MNSHIYHLITAGIILFGGVAKAQITDTLVVAVIGDYGRDSIPEADVASLVKSWAPDLIITLGDNNYNEGYANTIDDNIGQYYSDYIYPYSGGYTSTADSNRFFPSLGNHDYYCSGCPNPYMEYFTLPGNERYYDFRWGPVHFFAINSNEAEPDGATDSSTQAIWLQSALAATDAPFRLVYFHHAPYASGWHGNLPRMQWPFAAWGADAVLAGHEHHYERLQIDSIPYFVNGLGGSTWRDFYTIRAESKYRFTGDYGAMKIVVTERLATFTFVTSDGTIHDPFTIQNDIPLTVEPGQLVTHGATTPPYPNPFNPAVNIPVNLSQTGYVSIAVWDVMGRRVAVLAEGNTNAGVLTLAWDGIGLDGDAVPSGIYLVAVVLNGELVTTKKLLLVR